MTMPTPTKTWSVFDTNNGFNSTSRLWCQQKAMYEFKEFLKAHGWTVERSSGYVGGTTWTAGAADYWDMPEAIVGAISGNHAWIVLKSANHGGGNLEICILCKQASYYQPPGIYVSAHATGWTGGSTTVDPTNPPFYVTVYANAASDSGAWAGEPGQHYWNGAASSDGQCIWFWIEHAGFQTMHFFIERIKNPVSGVATADNWAILFRPAQTANTDKLIIGNYVNGALGHSHVLASSLACNYFRSVEGCGTDGSHGAMVVGTNPRDSSTSPLYPLGLFTNASLTVAYGRDGELFDLWLARADIINGSTYPGDGSRAFLQVGDFVLPWDGSIPSLS
jgi:hypothetical protein